MAKTKFSIGEKYRGLVDNKIYTVQEILDVGWYRTSYGGEFYRRHPEVVFRVGEGPKTCSIPLLTAEHLLLMKGFHGPQQLLNKPWPVSGHNRRQKFSQPFFAQTEKLPQPYS